MAQTTFDDADVRAAMRAYLHAAEQLDSANAVGSGARDLLDLAEAKSIAGMVLRRKLTELGWSPPPRADVSVSAEPQRSPTTTTP